MQACEVEVSVKPWPLQAFWPLQALVALLQALWPLQALVPLHFTPSACAAVMRPPAAKIDAAVAMSVRLVIICSLTVTRLRRGRTTLHAVYASVPGADDRRTVKLS